MKVWSNNLPLNDSRLSPIYGELFGLPPIYIFGGGREIYLPDMKRLAYMLEDMRQPVQLYTFKMVNAFALLPIRESHKVVKEIVNTIHDKR